MPLSRHIATRSRLRAFVLAAMLATLAASPLAQQGGAPGPAPGPAPGAMAPMGPMGGPPGMASSGPMLGAPFGLSPARMKQLHDALKLDARQQQLWSDAEAAMLDETEARRRDFAARRERMRTMQTDVRPNLRALAAEEDAQADAAIRRHRATRDKWITFDETLSADQRAILRLALPEPGRGGAMHGGPGQGRPMERGGPGGPGMPGGIGPGGMGPGGMGAGMPGGPGPR